VLADHLPGGDVEPIPEVDRRDVEHERAELRLVEVLGGGVPDRVRDRLGLVGDARQDLGQANAARSASLK
jgi:hypothetical protein